MSRLAAAVTFVLVAAMAGSVRADGATAAASQTGRKVVIAHRGASGYLPEHTLASYAMAYGAGADFIETDVVLTRDGVPIAAHDITLGAITDVAQRFPGRARSDGKWYAADFTLAEIKTLAVRGRGKKRFRGTGSGFRIATFDDVLEMIGELNRLTGRDVGVYPETKDPKFHAREGLALEEAVLKALESHGYRDRAANVRIQSFDAGSLRKIRGDLGSDLLLVQLISSKSKFNHMVTEAGLDDIATYADGIAPSKGRVRKAADDGGGNRLVRMAHRRGLFVHVYTLKADDVPGRHKTFEAEMSYFLVDQGVDGVFTDHMDRAVAFVRALGRTNRSPDFATGTARPDPQDPDRP